MMTVKNPLQLQTLFDDEGYIAEKDLAMSAFLALQLNKPLLVEGPPGVGKTEIAKALASVLNTNLIRLQCYEGLDANHAIYEWNYQRQLLHLKLAEKSEKSISEKETEIFSDAFLLKRPLLQAITHPHSPVLLIDEIDRADEEFESFLLEILSDWQITIPEIGSITAMHIPCVVVTSNRVRELSEALRRRCLYLWIDYPDINKELAIVKSKVPGIDDTLAGQICRFMQALREMKLEKTPGVAESIDWAKALAVLHYNHLDQSIVQETFGLLIKTQQDSRIFQDAVPALLEKI